MVADDIEYRMMQFASENHGLFKNSSFNYLADAPRTWRERDLILQRMVDMGFFDKRREEGHKVYYYYLTMKGYNALDGIL